MSVETLDVTEIYEQAEIASRQYNPGQQVDIAALMRAAFMHGYAQALLVCRGRTGVSATGGHE